MLISFGLKEFAKVRSLWLCMVFSLRKIFAFSSHTVSEFAWNICEADAVTLSKIFALIFTLLVLMFCKSQWICMNCVCSCCICLLAFSVNVLFHSFPGMIDFLQQAPHLKHIIHLKMDFIPACPHILYVHDYLRCFEFPWRNEVLMNTSTKFSFLHYLIIIAPQAYLVSCASNFGAFSKSTFKKKKMNRWMNHSIKWKHIKWTVFAILFLSFLLIIHMKKQVSLCNDGHPGTRSSSRPPQKTLKVGFFAHFVGGAFQPLHNSNLHGAYHTSFSELDQMSVSQAC